MGMGMTGSAGRRRGGGRGSRRAPMAEINVTPFVDVMLVLLIIFMVTAPMLTAGVPVELPDANADSLPQDKQEITITIAVDGMIYIDADPLAPGGLPQKLAEITQNGSGDRPQVTLRADKALDYGRVMAVMGELNHNGFNSIALVTSGSSKEP